MAAEGADAATRRFWSEVALATPLVDPVPGAPGERIVTFVWRDAQAAEVLLFANRLTDEKNIDESLLERLPGTDVWHLAYRMDADWRASYSFLVRGAGERAPWRTDDDQVALRAALDRGRRDLRNPVTSRNRAGVDQSVVELPDAPRQPWLAASPASAPREVESPGGRRLWIHEAATGGELLPLVLVLDGEVWRSILPAAVDAMVAAGVMRPARLVFVDSGGTQQRWRELDAGGEAAAWLAGDLVPWVRARWATEAGPGAVVVAGQSLGGFTAVRTALEHPDVVGAALAQSASTWQGDLAALAGAAGRSGLRVWLEVGRQEWVLRDAHRHLAARLAAAGADVRFTEFNGGHDYACWRGGIADGLAALLPG
ncbi:esterase family protein [Microbacterium fluvii]